MRVEPDDKVYEVENTWLGPKEVGDKIPWPRARFSAWGIFVVAFLGGLTVQRAIGIDASGWSFAWGVVIALGCARFLGAKVSHERPVSALLAMFAADLTAPRRGTRIEGLVNAPGRWRAMRDRRRALGELVTEPAPDFLPPDPGQAATRRRWWQRG